jgi:hypothetical protein
MADLEEPLLEPTGNGDSVPQHAAGTNRQPQSHGTTTVVAVGQVGGVLNLVKCILGAGLLSMPRALSLLGGYLSLASMAAVVRDA